MGNVTSAEGGKEGQNGGIAIGTGHAKADEISFNGVIIKSTDPDYEKVRDMIISNAMRNMGKFK